MGSRTHNSPCKDLRPTDSADESRDLIALVSMVNNGHRFDEIDGMCIRKAESTVARSSFGIDRFFRIGCAMKDGKRYFDRTRRSKDDEAWIAPTRLCEASRSRRLLEYIGRGSMGVKLWRLKIQ